MTVRNIKKNLAGAEDLLHGIGLESQVRGGAVYDMHKLDTYVPTYDIAEMQKSSLIFMRLYGDDTHYTDYRRNPAGTVGIPSDLGGVWEPIKTSELQVVGNSLYGAYVYDVDQVMCHAGTRYSWSGAFPKVVAAGSTPETTGGIGAGAWVDRTDVTLRSALDYIMTSYPLDATSYLPDGFVIDGSVSYTAQLQQAINDAAGYRCVLLPNFPVLIDPTGTPYGGLQIPSNSKVIWQAKSELHILANNLDNYEIVGMRDVSNVELFNPVVYGDKYTHTGTTGEWGMGISIRGACSDIKVHYPRVYNCWGDGYYIGQISSTIESTPSNINIVNPIARSCRRQGMSVASVDGLILEHPEFYGTKSSDSVVTLSSGPHAGIDFEPNSVNSKLNNIRISGLCGGGNDGGLFYVYLGSIVSTAASPYHVDIKVDSVSDDGSTIAANFAGLNETSVYSGGITIDTVNSNDSVYCPIQSRNWPVICNLPVNVNIANLNNWVSSSLNPAYLRSAVTVRYSGSNAAYPAIGNLFINRLNLTNTLDSSTISDAAIYLLTASNNGISNVQIKMGTVYATKALRCEGVGSIALEESWLFKKALYITYGSSFTFLPNYNCDIDVTPTGGSPTCTLPDTYPTLHEGNVYRFKYTQGGTASYCRMRSNTVPMYVNGVIATNILFSEVSGIVTLKIRSGFYFVTSEGLITKES